MISYEELKLLCKEKGVTIAKVERDLGFSKGSLCKIDKNIPSVEKLEKLSRYFNVSTEYLMKGDEAKNKYYIDDETAKLAQELLENPEYKILFDAPKNLQPEDLKAIIHMIEALQNKEKGE